nr:MarR family winged helix-turn-helix transcriptional regulator [Lysinibacillus timonensis]
MENQLQRLGIVNLILERRELLREISEEAWSEKSDIKISNTEWYIMARIYGQTTTISYVTKNVAITRQATHKNIKSLEAKGLVEISNSEHNKRDKCIRLTELGCQCFVEYEEMKDRIEQKIAHHIGGEKVAALKEILKMDWGI